MAQPSKFVSVNLNKSYGRLPNSSTTSSSSAAYGRLRGSGGMLVLSRPRSSGSSGQKGPPKLSVPPPLNLPSLRKEHERFDPSSAPGSSARPGSSGIGSGTGSSTMGWTKPALFPSQDAGVPPATQDARSGGTYMPPSAQSSGHPPSPTIEKAVFLRSEDFPSLRATTVTPIPKQKESLKQKRQPGEENAHVRMEKPELHTPLDMRPQMRSSRPIASSTNEMNNEMNEVSFVTQEQPCKQGGYFPGPLPIVRLSHTSDWADDERDTGSNIPERERRFSRIDSGHDFEGGNGALRETFRGDSFRRDVPASGRDVRDVSSWRTPQLRDGSDSRKLGVDRNRVPPKPLGMSREMGRESNYSHLSHAENAKNGYGYGAADTHYGRRDLGPRTTIQNGRNVAETYIGRAVDQNQHGQYGDLSNNRYRGDAFENNKMSKNTFSSGSKGFSLNDPILNFGREKRLISNGKPYLDEGGLDGSDPFSGGLLGEASVKVFKRKKDALKQADFHDPVRESFEAELERVQRMQEQERQRVMEEQARVLELARREHEEREKLAREEEERRRRLEEEEREAAWRAEQEKLEAVRRADELRIAREEEKRRMFMEEERRKEAARRKLLELEARIAKRQAQGNLKDDKLQSSVSDERLPVLPKEKDALGAADIGEWEDGERMVEHITSTVSSDSSSMNTYFDTGPMPHSSRDVNPSFMERGNHANNWRRDTYDNGNTAMFFSQDQDNDYHNPRGDAVSTSRGFSRKERHGNLGPPARPLLKGVTSEALQVPDDFGHSRHRWNFADGDYFNKNVDNDAEFFDNDKFGDTVWGPGHSRGNPHASYSDRLYQNSEVDGYSTFGRSRHSLRQPRVHPPPSVSSVRRSPFRAVSERPISPPFLDSEMRYQHTGKAEEASCEPASQEKHQQSATAASLAQNNVPSQQNADKSNMQCDSQSSLSFSSPPASPTHLSHEDLDESEDFQTQPASAAGEQAALLDNENIMSPDTGDTNIMMPSSSVSHGEDDEWATENHEILQEQEEYDDDNDGYEEEEEAHDGNADILDVGQEIDDIQSKVMHTFGEADQVVLGFDEGVQVNIPINDEFEKTFRNNKMDVGVQVGIVGAMQRTINSDSQRTENEDALPEGSVNDSCKIIIETEKALQDLVLDPGGSASCTAGSQEGYDSSKMLTQESVSAALSSSMPVTSSVQPMPSLVSTCSVQPTLSSASTLSTQPEVPIKLQFGLFSGPSLIPSPVPAIQIGSIQMPLHLCPQVSPSIPQTHSSQPSLLQFGQLRYTSPISQGIMSLAPQTISFGQPPSSAHYSLNQNLAGFAPNRESQESSTLNNSRNKVVSGRSLVGKQSSLVAKPSGAPQNNIECGHINAVLDPSHNKVASQSQTGSSSFVEVRSRYVSASPTERPGNRDVTVKNYRHVVNNFESQLHVAHNSSQFFSGEKTLNGSKATGTVSGGRGRRYAYTLRNAGSRAMFSGPDVSQVDTSGFQRRPRRNIRRTEFRVRENTDNRQRKAVESFNSAGQDGKPNINAKMPVNSARYGGKRDTGLSKLTKMATESENLSLDGPSPQMVNSDGRTDRVSRKDTPSKKRTSSVPNFHAGEGNMQRNGASEDDIDAPLQSNIVRVFNQPGIEAPSDEDDFIQVRSKRQMLNDRRERREKEIKAKSRMTKAPRKTRVVPQSNTVKSKSNRVVSSLSGDRTNSARSGSRITDRRGFANVEASPRFSANSTSQPLPPIGTPSLNNSKSNSLKSGHTSSVSAVTSGGTKFIPGLSFENNSGAFDNVSMPLASWTNTDLNQQVMALTQSQLDEAMQPGRFDSHASSSIAHEPTKLSSSIVMPENAFSSSASTFNVLPEKIQFGAVTSPIFLPPVNRAIFNGIGPPGAGRSDNAIPPKLPAGENSCAIFFDKEKLSDESHANLEDPEAEAEAAASAVAVAAISNNDEIVGNRLSSCSISVSDRKNFSASDTTMLTAKGVTGSQEGTGQSAAEDSLAVSLPADLSVDTPSFPLWPPLPSPQSSSGPMLSHFPGAPPSHYPCFEMSPMLGRPIFSFGPHDESAGTQAQPQRSTTMGSGPPGAWQQCHSTVDSFYGPATGFTGPFISPPGAIPGVQGPMVVYNHFTPVGQFGKVGLSFMGTTYIATGKQPEWKHNPLSSAVTAGESVGSNLNIVSGPRNPPNMPSIQHLAPGSPLMPMASPLTMFDIPPFQSSIDIPLQARWSHIPAPSIHSLPQSAPWPHQVEVMPSQFNHSLPGDTSAGNNRLHEPMMAASADASRGLSVPKNATTQFPVELGLVDPQCTTSGNVETSKPSGNPASGNDSKGIKSSKSSARSAVANAGESGSNRTTNGSSKILGSTSRPRAPQQSSSSGQQYVHPTGHTDQRGSGTSQKVASGGEWHRRMGYQGRNRASGPDKNFASSKVKQIYVAKSPSGNAASS